MMAWLIGGLYVAIGLRIAYHYRWRHRPQPWYFWALDIVGWLPLLAAGLLSRLFFPGDDDPRA